MPYPRERLAIKYRVGGESENEIDNGGRVGWKSTDSLQVTVDIQ